MWGFRVPPAHRGEPVPDIGRSGAGSAPFGGIPEGIGAADRPRPTVGAASYDAGVMRFEQVGDGARPPWWRTVLAVLTVSAMSLFSLVFSPLSWSMQHGASGAVVLLTGWGMLVAVGLPVLLGWRHRWPFLVTFVAAGASVVLPLGNSFPLVALAGLLGRRRGPAVWAVTALVAATSTWVVVADTMAQPRGASFWKSWLGPQQGDPSQALDLSVTEIVVVIVLGLVVSIGSGLVVRWRREAATATDAVQVERVASGRLGDEVARRQERERIAREVHDAMGHRLSLVNLHAGALEANATDDPRMAQSAQLVRESAGAAMDDLRSLLEMLREPADADLPPVPLSELANVVQDSFGAGQALSSSIFIQDPEDADPALTRAVYRIVQELLTNARKHAPSEHVFLTVQGSPSGGVVIDARNRYVGGWGGGPAGSSRGLAGIAERVALLGGTLTHGLDGDDFRIHVKIPWRSAS